MIDDERLDRTLNWLAQNASKAAQARAERIYMEEWIPSLRSRIAAKHIAEGDSAAAAEVKARGSTEYAEALLALKDAVELDEKLRWERTRADAIVSAWQTLSANARALGKGT